MNAGILDLEAVFSSWRKIYGPTAANVNRRIMVFPQKKEPRISGALLIKNSAWDDYFFTAFLMTFFFGAGFAAAFFFGAGFFAAGFAFFTAAFFLDAAATVFFLEATGPLFIIGSSQQIISAAAQPHSSSTITASPHTSQLNTSPAFTLAISYPPRY
jgi:hypothetical protein